MIDFNHDGKIDERDYLVYEEFIENENTKDEYTLSRSTGYSRSSDKKNNGKIGILDFVIIMTIIITIGYIVMAFAGELIATVVIIIIFIFLFAKG